MMINVIENSSWAYKDNVTEKLSFSQKIFLLGMFSKQFYLLPSGSFQVGDLILMLSFAAYIIQRRGVFKINRQNDRLLLYFLCIVIINFIYGCIYNRVLLFKPILYYVYNLFVIIFFSANIRFESNKRFFLQKVSGICQVSLIMNVLIYLSGLGRWFGSVRYMGTFNDPNQYGVFVFFSMLCIYFINTISGKRTIPWIVIGIALILPSASTGNMIGSVVFVASMLCMQARKLTPIKAVVFVAAVLAGSLYLIGVIAGLIQLPSFITSSYMFERILQKISKISSFNSGVQTGSLLSDRGWRRIFQFPEYLLFGSGEGYYERFGTTLEVHSSILGPLFYYGIFPFSIYTSWTVSKIRKIDRRLWCVYFGLFSEAFFLINTRQPLFWMLHILTEAAMEDKMIDSTCRN